MQHVERRRCEEKKGKDKGREAKKGARQPEFSVTIVLVGGVAIN
jgi:hypothetical protein